MISPSDAYKFIDSNVAILANSGINIDVANVKKYVENGTFTKKDFLSYIDTEISHFIYQWFYCFDTRNTTDYDLLIIDVRKSGKDFKYTYLKDVEPFKSRELKSIQRGNEGLIVSFTDGKLYRMKVSLKRGHFNPSYVSFSELDFLPEEIDAAELKNLVLQVLKPVLEFQHENEDTTRFMRDEFLKYIPFEDHSWMTSEDEAQVSNWEYCITNGPWVLSRDTVNVILSMFLSALEEYSYDTTAPDGWCEVVNNAISSINSLLGVAAPPPRFRKSSLRSRP